MPTYGAYQTIYEGDRVQARHELLAALTRFDAYQGGRLRVTNLKPRTIDALLELLTDVGHEDWTGLESGASYRSYRGRLRSGLPVEVIVELVDEPEHQAVA